MKSPSFEHLESRRLFAVTLDANGYTTVTPAADSRLVYVSKSIGSDTNDGLSPNTPVRSFTTAMALIRPGSADQMLLKRGDTFTNGIRSWRLSGRSVDEPILVGTYGEGARPRVLSGASTGFDISGSPSARVDNLVVQGIEFYANTYTGRDDPATGIGVYMNGANLLFEDCYVHGYKDNVVLGMSGILVSNVRLRKNVIADSYSVSVGHAQGLYADSTVRGIVLEGNVFDHNGWNESVPGALPTKFNHNIYIQTGATGVVVTDNIITNGSLHGAMVRPGGRVQNNVFIGNAIGLAVMGPDPSLVTGNVILDGRDLPDLPQGYGINADGFGGTLIYDNVIAHDDSDNPINAGAIFLNSSSKAVAVTKNVIYDWQRGLRNNSLGQTWVTANDFQDKRADKVLIDHNVAATPSRFHYADNRYASGRSNPFTVQGASTSAATWATTFGENVGAAPTRYPDPERSAVTYGGAYGRASSGVYIANARLMSREQPLSFYSAAAFITYIREGFGLSATPETKFPLIPVPSRVYNPYFVPTGKTTTRPDRDTAAGTNASTLLGLAGTSTVLT